MLKDNLDIASVNIFPNFFHWEPYWFLTIMIMQNDIERPSIINWFKCSNQNLAITILFW